MVSIIDCEGASIRNPGRNKRDSLWNNYYIISKIIEMNNLIKLVNCAARITWK